MNPICCTALIGTYNSARTLPKTLATVRARTMPALAYVIVDCGSTDNTPACVADDAVVHRYVGAAFNDSEALNAFSSSAAWTAPSGRGGAYQ